MEVSDLSVEKTVPKKRGRKKKAELTVLTEANSEMEILKSRCLELEEENSRLKKIVNLISVTTKKFVECTDEEINMLYIKFLTDGQTTLNNARILKSDNKLIIPKSYYEV